MRLDVRLKKIRLMFSICVAINVTFQTGASAEALLNGDSPHVSRVDAMSQEIMVGVARQDAKGKTQQDFDLNFLNNLEAYTVDRLKTKAKEHQASHGRPNAKVDLISKAAFVEYGTLKLAVIKISSNPVGVNQVWITGIRDKELIRVVCVRRTTESIPLTYGNCGDKIQEVFGRRMGF